MNVNIALFAYLADFQPDGFGGRHARGFDLPDGTTVGGVIETLGLPDEMRIILVNGRNAEEDVVLAERDRIAIFPPVAGG